MAVRVARPMVEQRRSDREETQVPLARPAPPACPPIGLAIAPGTAGFLLVSLYACWQAHSGDKAHIGFVDAHAESDGCHDNEAFFADET